MMFSPLLLFKLQWQWCLAPTIKILFYIPIVDKLNNLVLGKSFLTIDLFLYPVSSVLELESYNEPNLFNSCRALFMTGRLRRSVNCDECGMGSYLHTNCYQRCPATSFSVSFRGPTKSKRRRPRSEIGYRSILSVRRREEDGGRDAHLNNGIRDENLTVAAGTRPEWL